MDSEAEFRIDDALRLFRNATEADREFLPAHLSFIELMIVQGRHVELRRKYQAAASRNEIAECLAAIATGMRGHDLPEQVERYNALVRRWGRTPCSEVAKISSHTGPVRVDLLRQAGARYGMSPKLAIAIVTAMRQEGNPRARQEILREEIAKNRLPLLSFGYRLMLIRELDETGNVQAARTEARALASDFKADSRPLIRWKLWDVEAGVFPMPTTDRGKRDHALYLLMRDLARRHGASGYEFEPMMREARYKIDHGDLTGAVGILNDAIRLAERIGSEEFRQWAYLSRGRALAEQGKRELALKDLEKAAASARLLGERYRLADAYHHIMHAHQSRSDWPAAIIAADSFVKIGATVHDRSMRMVRLNDAAAVNWKAGFHARAEHLYAEMVRTIERDSANFEYAGAYLERKGDLERAAQYYRWSVLAGYTAGQPKIAYAGLTRVFEQRGMMDSAIANARKHDALLTTPEREILLPRLLARQGKVSEALQQANQWTKLQMERGNPGATASALNQQAELFLLSDPQRTLQLVSVADSVARSVNSSVDIITARRIGGLARARTGDVGGAARELLSALSMAAKTSDPFLKVTLSTDLANLWSKAGQHRRSLVWFEKSDAALHLALVNSEDPVVAAQIRSARSAIFDGAIRTILAMPPDSSTALLEWSNRKKRSGSQAWGRRMPRLAPSEVIVDYLTVGDSVVATVITNRGRKTVLLGVSASEVERRATQLVAPLRDVRNGNVDLTRTLFPEEHALFLYQRLIAPIERLIGSRKIVTIVPDVPLQLVPFDALVISPAARDEPANRYLEATYVLDRWTISYAPTISAARKTFETRSFSKRNLVFVSHAAPGVEAEKSAISSVWPGKSLREIVGSKATERAVRTIGPSKIVHFATHAVSDDADPLNSHLALEPSNGDDGLLHASEIRRWHWDGSIIFLSACETATGPMFAGTGTLSLARAFADGGASEVVATGWAVGNASAEISKSFYGALARGASVGKALHESKLRIRRNPRSAHPFFWASHILISGRQ